MKQALSQNGEIINASPEAPKQAICPYCQGAVMLRHRSLMNNGEPSYYWRHLNNRNRTCKARTNLIQFHIPNRSLYNRNSNPL
ncbi:MAG: hypothetical protein DWQ04_15890 [Chloroflexi bacterium]|nr:MAG: hypothetical protein DWQ04_15890 [Chloroflexota bacterium]